MDKPVIETADDFMRHQQDAIECGHHGEPGGYWPTNEDLLKVLKGWRGMVCIDVLTEDAPLSPKVVKGDLIDEIQTHWSKERICPLSISCVNRSVNVLVLTCL